MTYDMREEEIRHNPGRILLNSNPIHHNSIRCKTRIKLADYAYFECPNSMIEFL